MLLSPPIFLNRAKPATIAHQSHGAELTAVSSKTFSGMNFGAPFQGRKLLILFNYASGQGHTVSSFTVGGIVPTLILGPFADSFWRQLMYIMPEETLSSGNIACSLTGVADQWAVGVYALGGLKSMTPVDVQKPHRTKSLVVAQCAGRRRLDRIAHHSTRRVSGHRLDRPSRRL